MISWAGTFSRFSKIKKCVSLLALNNFIEVYQTWLPPICGLGNKVKFLGVDGYGVELVLVLLKSIINYLHSSEFIWGFLLADYCFYCCMLQRFGLLKACICSHTMAITGRNDHIGSAALTKRNRRSSGKIFGSKRLDETCRRINKFYNYCSQKTIH